MSVFAENDTEKRKSYPYLDSYTSFLKQMERPLVGREREMDKLLAAMQRPELCNVILLAAAGSGKALCNRTPIPVADARGYVCIEDIKVGDRVFDNNGIPSKVLGVYPQGEMDAYMVTFSDHSTIICNDEHIWAVRDYDDRKKGKPYHEATLREIIDKGLYKNIRRKNKKGRKKVPNCYIPVCKPVERADYDFDIPPYAMGVFINKGYFDNEILTVEIGDCHIAMQVADDIGVRYYSRSVYNKGYFQSAYNNGIYNFIKYEQSTESDRIGGYITREDLSNIDRCCEILDNDIDERRIPMKYFSGSKRQRFYLLQGLMDTSGNVSDDVNLDCTFETTSEGLASDFLELVNSLGMRATCKIIKHKSKKTKYFVRIYADHTMKIDLFKLPKYHSIILNWLPDSLLKCDSCVNDMAITNIEKLNDKLNMTCIYVDSPDHLFLADKSYIVTHNTALVQGTMLRDTNRAYLEVDLPKMIANLNNENEMADKLKQLFDEVARFGKEYGKEIVLFIDEFHQIVQLSPAAVEVLKPLLADSGTRGIRVIAATTYIEFQDYISSNQPLVERLQRINLAEPDKETVIEILKGMATRYGVIKQFRGDAMFEAIYEYTNRYVPANAQPRKSILMMDSMIGWHRFNKAPIDLKMLSDVIYDTEGVNITFRVDATTIKRRLDVAVFAQQYASSAIENRLQICCADLNNKEKPMSSFLFTGSTGVGKGLINEEIIPVWTPDNSIYEKKNGDLKIGDYVFNRKGEPVKVVGVFPRGKQDIYKVTLTDGRILYTDSSHLWTYMAQKGKYTENTYTNSTKELYDRGVYITAKDGRHKLNYWIPMNQPVQYPEMNLSVHPYVMGAFIGDGCLTVRQLLFSSSDEDLVQHVAELLGDCTCDNGNHRNYNWTFPLIKPLGKMKLKQTNNVFADYPEVNNKLAHDKRIPAAYMHASIEQRWQLIKGLFDTDGSIGDSDNGRYNVSYSTISLGLAEDIQKVLFSLGVASTIQVARVANEGKYTQYRLNVKSSNENKDRFFWLPRKVEIANKAKTKAGTETKSHKKDYAWVGIAEIELLDEQKETTCIYVDDEEHLYQAGQYVVTHNTEMTKQLANILFGDDRSLIRLDMTEYALDDSLERFRDELTTKVWTKPYSIVLLDEIEKACAPVTRLLLQVLDDGRLIDRNNREVTFKNCYIIVTTNAGSEIYKTIAQYNADDAGSGAFVSKYETLIRDSISGTTGGGKFPAELLGRIDCIVPFQPLSESTMGKICASKMQKLYDQILKKHGIRVIFQADIIRYIVQEKMTTDSDAGGARAVISRFEREVVTNVARFINNVDKKKLVDNTISVVVVGKMATDDKNLLESDAHIEVLYGDIRVKNN